MKSIRKWLLVALSAIFACLGATPALAAEGDFLYNPDTVNVIEMTLPQPGIEGLEDEPFEYQPGGTVVVTPTDGTPGGKGTPSKTFQNVEIKLKGQVLGSFQDLDHKAAFKLKFKKAEPFFGLRKLTLNNMAQDPSMIHESLAYTAFAAAGVPASRSGYAYVWLNGKNYGLHLDLESLDETSLARIFGTPFDKTKQHLYEAAEYGADFYPGKESRFEVDEGEPSTSDLTALIAAVDGATPNPLPPGLTASVDLDEMTRMWGVEKYIGHWDGYAGQGIPGEEGFNEHRPNNYYLYSDASGRFSMLPWGTDQTWDTLETGGVPISFDEQDGRLFDLCLEDATCAGMFSAAVANALEKVGGLDLETRAAVLEAMLRPWQALEEDPRQPYGASAIAAAVDNTCDFIAQRPAEAEAWLDDEAPAAAPSGNGCPPLPVPPLPSTDPAPAPTASTPPSPASRTMTTLGIERGDGVIRLKVRVEAPGAAVLVGTTPIAGDQKRVCGDKARVDRARGLTLSCQLSSRALRRLRHHALLVDLRATFTPYDAGPAVFRHRVTLARDRGR